MLNTNSIIIEVSYRRSTKDSYSNFLFNYHDDDVEGSTPLLNEEKNHYLDSTKLSPILPEAKFKFETQHVKSNEQVLSLENNVKKSTESEVQDAQTVINDDKLKTLTSIEEEPLVDLPEVSKSSKKKKNKKNQKVTTNDSEDGKNLPPNAAVKKTPELETTTGDSVLVQVETVEDSTVVSFLEDSHLSQDWL